MKLKIGNSNHGCKISMDDELASALWDDVEEKRLIAVQVDETIVVRKAGEGEGSSIHAQKNQGFPWCTTLARSDPLHTRSEVYGAEELDLVGQNPKTGEYTFSAPRKHIPVRERAEGAAPIGSGGGGKNSMQKLVDAVELINSTKDDLNIRLSIDEEGYLEVTQRIGRSRA